MVIDEFFIVLVLKLQKYLPEEPKSFVRVELNKSQRFVPIIIGTDEAVLLHLRTNSGSTYVYQ